MITAVWDFHIGSPWASRARQHKVLDMIEARRPDSAIFAGDTFDPLFSGVGRMLADPVFLRMLDIAYHIPIQILRGNFPHDNARELERIREDIAPMHIWPDGDHLDIVCHGVTYRIIHGHQFDPRTRVWDWFRWARWKLPALGRYLLPRLPSDLVGMGKRSAGRITRRIHQRALRQAARDDVLILMGHTHVVGSAWVEELGEEQLGKISAVLPMGASGCDQGPALLATLDPREGFELYEIPAEAEIRALSAVKAQPDPTHRPPPPDENAQPLHKVKIDSSNQSPTGDAANHD